MNGRFLLFFPVISLGTGVIAGWYGGEMVGRGWRLLISGLLFLAGLLHLFPGKRATGHFHTASVLVLLFFSMGLWRGGEERYLAERFFQAGASFLGKQVLVRGAVTGEPSAWRDGLRFYLRVETIEQAVFTSSLQWEVFYTGNRAVKLGDRLELTGTLFGEAPSSVSKWTRERIAGGFLVDQEELAVIGRARLNPITSLISRLRFHLLGVGNKTLTPEGAGLLHGMLLGEKGELPKVVEEDIRKAGAAHLLSVSGLHLFFWLSLLYGVGKSLRLPGSLLSGLSLPLIFLFILLSGAGAPALRAGIMSALAFCGEWGKRAVRRESLLAAAAGIILLLRPLEIFAPGFWLSFAACGGLLIVYPAWEKGLEKRRYKEALKPLLLSLSVQATTLPLTLSFFGGVALLAPITNLVLVPLGSAVVQLGLVSAVTGLFSLPVARLINAGNEVFLLAFRSLAKLLAEYSGFITLSPWPLWVVAAFYMVMMVSTWGIAVNPVTGKRRLPLFYPSLILLVVALVAVGWGLFGGVNNDLLVVALDVGQGDAIFFKTPDGLCMLVDGGTGSAYHQEIKPFLTASGIDHLDIVVLTHPHEDHLGGLVKLLEDGSIRVSTVLGSGYPHTTSGYYRFLELLVDREINYQQVARGSSFRLGELKVQVLNPPLSYLSGTGSDINNNSLVLLMEFGRHRLLLTGDIEEAAEEDLLSAYDGAPRVNLLKVAHHGSSSATREAMITSLRPEIALISAGRENQFGHPSQEVVEALQRADVRVFRTDKDGRLTLRISRGKARLEAGGDKL